MIKDMQINPLTFSPEYTTTFRRSDLREEWKRLKLRAYLYSRDNRETTKYVECLASLLKGISPTLMPYFAIGEYFRLREPFVAGIAYALHKKSKYKPTDKEKKNPASTTTSPVQSEQKLEQRIYE